MSGRHTIRLIMVAQPAELPLAEALEPETMSGLTVVREDRSTETVVKDHEQPFRVRNQRVTLDDKSHYDVRSFEPQHPSDLLATYTTPWCTDLDGFNDFFGRSLARRGIQTVAVSPRRAHIWDLPREWAEASLSHDANAQHAILDWYLQQHDPQVEADKAVVVGYSRGAMVGLGVHAVAHAYNRTIVYDDFTDPCVARKLSREDIDGDGLLAYLGSEVIEAVSGMSHYRLKQLGKLATTAPLSAAFWSQQIAVTKAVFSGEAGSFADRLPADTTAHIVLYDKSIFNHARQWQQKLAHLPFVSIKHRAGRHLTGMDPVVRQRAADRIAAVEQLYADQATPADIHRFIAGD